MSLLNSLLRPVFDLIQAPMSGLPPLVGITLWSIPVAIFALFVFKWTSNQERIAQVKSQIHACLFEIRLFNDDLRAIIRAQAEILRHVLHYQGLALVPMVFILPPLVLVMVQLHAFYGFQGLQPGESALFTVVMDERWQERWDGQRPPVTLELPDGLEAETPAVWVPELGEFSWQIGAAVPGHHQLTLRVDESTIHKTVDVTDAVVRLSPTRPDTSFLGQLEWPSEPPIPTDVPIEEIRLGYPDGEVSLGPWSLRWSYAWMVVFFVLTMVIAVALKGPLGVEL
jgi:uncharacterized membrane protein (DUF106 family)